MYEVIEEEYKLLFLLMLCNNLLGIVLLKQLTKYTCIPKKIMLWKRSDGFEKRENKAKIKGAHV